MADIELFNECIEKDKTVIDKIEDVDRLKELYQTYLQFYSFFNSEFDSFNAKLSNLSSLVTVSLGFFISIATFLVGKYVHPHCLNNIEISSVILTFIATLGLILLLILICYGQSFKKFLTLSVEFPLSLQNNLEDTSEKVFYQKMVFCLYKIVRRNSYTLEDIKKKFTHAFTGYVICVVIYLIALVSFWFVYMNRS